MGDTFKEVEAGVDLFLRLFTKLFGAYSQVKSAGKTPTAAIAEIDDHLTPGRPNSPTLSQGGSGGG